jgi:hypothetical protein
VTLTRADSGGAHLAIRLPAGGAAG